MTYPYGTVVTLVKRTKGPPDSFGNDTWVTTTVDVIAQAFDPGISSEQVQGQDVLTTQPKVFLPPGTDVSYLDAVIINGEQSEVDGSPSQPISPFTGWQPGVIVKLKRVTG